MRSIAPQLRERFVGISDLVIPPPANADGSRNVVPGKWPVMLRENFPVTRPEAVDINGDRKADVVLTNKLIWDDGGTPHDESDDVIRPVNTGRQACPGVLVDVGSVPEEVLAETRARASGSV